MTVNNIIIPPLSSHFDKGGQMGICGEFTRPRIKVPPPLVGEGRVRGICLKIQLSD